MLDLSRLLLLAAAAASAAAVPATTSNLIELAQELNLTTFVKNAKATGLDRIINHEGMFTVFAPSDAAFATETRYPSEAPLKEKMQFHVGRGKYMSKDLVDENTIKSLLSKRTIRFNLYPNGAVTANGRPISKSVDHVARNGVIHVIDGVMSSVYAREGSVISEIDECCPEHSDLMELVKLAGMYGMLDETGPFTFIAPVNAAFAKLHPDFIIHLKQNLTRLRNFLMGHIIPLTWYSPGFVDGQTVKTVAGHEIHVGVGDNGTITFGRKSTVQLADITAFNGVVHVVDEVLLPPVPDVGLDSFVKSAAHIDNNSVDKTKKNVAGASSDLPSVLRRGGFSRFAAALERTGAAAALAKAARRGSAFTVFAPTDAAMARRDPAAASEADWVWLHVARGVLKPRKVRDGHLVPTMLKGRTISFSKYRKEGEKTASYLANGMPVCLSDKLLSADSGVVVPLPVRPLEIDYWTN